MTFTDLTVFLADNGLAAPDLLCLHPDNDHYSSLLFQPGGTVEIRNDYIGPGTNQVIRKQVVDFFRNATERQVGLAIIPEYCCPLQTIQDTIQGQLRPANRNLWIVGVEAVTIQQLIQFKTALGPTVKVFWEEGLQTPQGNFLDPVFYIFQSQTTDSEPKLVIVVQFKTEPMADFTEIERTHMVRGTKIFVFNQTIPNKQKLTTLICSDSLSNEVQTKIADIQDRCLIVHIQLNPNPRKDVFKRYRDSVFARRSNETEILCLNWSMEIQSNPPEPFSAMVACGSAIYLKSPHVDRTENDDLIRQNHRLGLYTTYWPSKHTFCFFFNFKSAVYHYNISKAFSLENEVQWRRRGPQMSATLTWNAATDRWDESQGLPDNFPAVCADVNAEGLQHFHCPGYDPLNTERLMNLSIGFASNSEWFRISNLRTHQIDDAEKIFRLTFAQEKDPDVFRQRAANLSQFNNLRHIIEQRTPWPIWMSHISQAVVLGYQPERPHRNILAQDNFTATGIYFGNHSEANLAELYQRLEMLLATETIRRAGQNAIAIWYHQNGQDFLYRAEVRPTILHDQTEILTEIDRNPQQ
jgi:hypothetical protein